jgi:hypothetical protein
MTLWIALAILLLTLILVSKVHNRLAAMQAQADLMSKKLTALSDMQSRLFLTVMTAGERGKAASGAPRMVPLQQTNGHGDETLSDTLAQP